MPPDNCKWLKFTLMASMALNPSYSITQQSNGKIGEPQALIFVKITKKSSKFLLACDFTAISGFVDSTKRRSMYCVWSVTRHRVSKGDKMLIKAICETIIAKIHHFL